MRSPPKHFVDSRGGELRNALGRLLQGEGPLGQLARMGGALSDTRPAHPGDFHPYFRMEFASTIAGSGKCIYGEDFT